MNLMTSISNIELYYQWLLDNPKKANKKIVAVYKKLVDDIHKPKVVKYEIVKFIGNNGDISQKELKKTHIDKL